VAVARDSNNGNEAKRSDYTDESTRQTPRMGRADERLIRQDQRSTRAPETRTRSCGTCSRAPRAGRSRRRSKNRPSPTSFRPVFHVRETTIVLAEFQLGCSGIVENVNGFCIRPNISLTLLGHGEIICRNSGACRHVWPTGLGRYASELLRHYMHGRHGIVRVDRVL
jgi:hypothetical protein